MMSSNDVLIEVTDKLLIELRQESEIYDNIHNFNTSFTIRCIRSEKSKKEIYLLIRDNILNVIEICGPGEPLYKVLNSFPLVDPEFIDKLTLYVKDILKS